ncbi:hypothetical protein GCM10007987_25660 [Aliivibrio fischeri]|nr:hypothetical protein GCM10007987_25660 [Aliivibrio fischeri]
MINSILVIKAKEKNNKPYNNHDFIVLTAVILNCSLEKVRPPIIVPNARAEKE